MARIGLAANLACYVAPTGTDGGDFTDPQSPARTRQYVWERLARDYDLCGRRVVISLLPGTHADGFTAYGPMLGQWTAEGVTFRGDTADPGAVLIKPSSGYAFSPQNGARFFVEGVRTDMTQANADAMVPTDGSWLGLSRIIFGPTRYPYQDIQPGICSRVFVYGDYEVNRGSATRYANGAAGSNVIGVSSAAGLEPFMGVSAGFLTDGCWIESLSGPNNCTVTLGGGAAHTTVGAEPVTFSGGCQAHAQLDRGAWMGYASSPAAPLTVTIAGKPHFHSGFFVADAGELLPQATRFLNQNGAPAEASGPPFALYHGGVIHTSVALPNGDQDLAYLPGSRLTIAATLQAGSPVAVITQADSDRVKAFMGGRVGLCVTGAGVRRGSVVPSADHVGAGTLNLMLPAKAGGASTLTLAGFAWSGGEFLALDPWLSPPR